MNTVRGRLKVINEQPSEYDHGASSATKAPPYETHNLLVEN